MASVQSSYKQTRGYFLVVGATLTVGYTYGGATGAGGSWAPGTMTKTTVSVPVNSVLRDMGKTVVVGPLGVFAATATQTPGQNQRVFRKVQWVDHRAGSVTSNGVSNGAGGTDTATVGYDTFYIELPAAGQAGGAAVDVATPVVYVPGMPGL